MKYVFENHSRETSNTRYNGKEGMFPGGSRNERKSKIQLQFRRKW